LSLAACFCNDYLNLVAEALQTPDLSRPATMDFFAGFFRFSPFRVRFAENQKKGAKFWKTLRRNFAENNYLK